MSETLDTNQEAGKRPGYLKCGNLTVQKFLYGLYSNNFDLEDIKKAKKEVLKE